MFEGGLNSIRLAPRAKLLCDRDVFLDTEATEKVTEPACRSHRVGIPNDLRVLCEKLRVLCVPRRAKKDASITERLSAER